MSEVAPFRSDLEYDYANTWNTYEGMTDEELQHRAVPISRQTAEACLAFLRDTAGPLASWRSRRVWLSKYEKTVFARAYKGAKGSSQKERDYEAQVHPDYVQIQKDIEEAEYHVTLLSALRDAAHSKVSGWQTLNANARQGLVT
jgi:hypothetical protein